VHEEVADLNRLNLAIDQQQKRINMLNMVRQRNLHFSKNLKSQQQFNNQLAAEHKQRTNNLHQGLSKGGTAAEAEADQPGNIKYDTDP